MTARHLRVVGVIMLFTLMAACSFKTMYNRLDVLIPRYVEGVITLDDVLETELEQRTLVLLQWHRDTQLKNYAGWLQSLQQDIGEKATEARLEQHVRQLDEFWIELFVKLNDEMAYLLPLLDRQQRDELFIYLEDTNEEYRDDYVDIDQQQRVEDYTDRMIDSYERWIGDLTDAQLFSIEQAATELVDTAALRYQQRIAWQQGIRQILDSNDILKNRRERLRDFLAKFEQGYDSVLADRTAVNEAVLIRLTVQVSHSMTAEQKEFFNDKTGKYIRMFIELAEKR